MKARTTRLAMTALLFAALAATIPSAISQAYPAKTVRIILPYLGGTDFVARWLAGQLSISMGPVVVEPRVGAGGNIGHEAVAKAPPDGYTLMLAAPPLVINPNLSAKAGFDPLRDFVPIALVATIPNILAAHPSVPAKTLAELLRLARSNPGKLTIGNGGAGSTSHLAGELLTSLSKTKMLSVAYKGASFALIGAMSGEVDLVIPAASAAEPYVKDNRLRALVALDTKRVKSMPEVPTAAEAGMPQLLIVNWYALMAPAGTPRAVVARLNSELAKIMQSPETRKHFLGIGGEPIVSTPEQTADFIRAEFDRWGKVIRTAGIKGE